MTALLTVPPVLPIRYYAVHGTPKGELAEIHVEMIPGKFGARIETKTGRTFKTAKAAKAAMILRNCP